jgi:hypothetical protein
MFSQALRHVNESADVVALRDELDASSPSWCQHVLLTPQPIDQSYFRHHAAGRWRRGARG